MGMMFCTGCGKEIHETAPVCPHCGAPQRKAPQGGEKSQTVAALLCAFLGGFGAHRFYLGPIWVGVIYLLFCWTMIPGIIAFFETFIIVFASQESWARKHNNGVITDPAHIVIKVLVLIFPVLFFLGILAAIAIPAYSDYTQRAKSMGVLSALSGGKVVLAQHLESKGGEPLDEATLNEVKAAVGRDPTVSGVEAFAYGKYADVGAKLKLGAKEGMLYLVTRDGGQSWNCQAVNLTRQVPKTCEVVAEIRRPEIPKPVPKFGQWDKEFYQVALEACTQRALESGNAAGPEGCRCVLSKAAFAIPQEQMQGGDAQPQIKEQLQQFASECRPS